MYSACFWRLIARPHWPGVSKVHVLCCFLKSTVPPFCSKSKIQVFLYFCHMQEKGEIIIRDWNILHLIQPVAKYRNCGNKVGTVLLFKTWYQIQITSGLLSVEIINEKLTFMFFFLFAAFKNKASEIEIQLVEGQNEVSLNNSTQDISFSSKMIYRHHFLLIGL